jgi:aconitate hydratase
VSEQVLNSYGAKASLKVGQTEYDYFDLKVAAKKLDLDLNRLPFSMRVLFENLLRSEDGVTVTKADIAAIKDWLSHKKATSEINYYPARVLMQDFTGVPAVVDLAAMRDAMKNMGGNAQKINPLCPVDLVIDHSVNVEQFGNSNSFDENVRIEFEQNKERYTFLKWGQGALKNFRVVPPGTGICHQVNLENLAQVVWTKTVNNRNLAYCDTVVGTDSHTTMINGLAVLGWGVGGIEAEAAMLGQPVTMLLPEVIGFKLSGKLKDGVTATDLVLTVVEMLRKKGVVDKFVEFYGPGLDQLSLADRATLANMAPEYGATCGFFPIDRETINYLSFTGRDPERVKLVEAYAKAQGMWRDEKSVDPEFTDTLSLDISTVEPSIAGPKRPQDRIVLSQAATNFTKHLTESYKADAQKQVEVAGHDYSLSQGDVVIAAITSCTNTSNPSVMLAAGLVAKKACERGLKVKPWVKTSLAPGSQVVTDYLNKAGLQKHLDQLGFNLVGYGCTTCIGNSGPLPAHISSAIEKGDLVASAVLSGNRNFEGRISPHVKANFLASPPLVVAYAIAGNMRVDITKDSLGKDSAGRDVYLKDIWPSQAEVNEAIKTAVTSEQFKTRYANVFLGPKQWQAIETTTGETYAWDNNSTYVQNPPYFVNMKKTPEAMKNINGARALAILGDSVTTDHISPAGSIKASSPAGTYLQDHGVAFRDFNSYGSRRGNHEVMMRGTFANIRIKNEMLDGVEGGYSKYIPTGEQTSIYEASMKYQQTGTPLVVIGGKEYGTGSSRDWAAKGTNLLGVKAVVAESFERIHRSNLIGMGVLPLEFKDGVTRKTLNLKGDEVFDIAGVETLKPRGEVVMTITRANGSKEEVKLRSRVDTVNELEYLNQGGILHYVLRKLNS